MDSGTTVTQNGTYISNSGYPTTISGATDNTFSISPENPQVHFVLVKTTTEILTLEKLHEKVDSAI